MPASASPRRLRLCALAAAAWRPAVIVLAVLAAYSNSIHATFTFDDPGSIAENPSIRSFWPPWRHLMPPDIGGQTVDGRPVLNLSLAANYAVGGLSVRSYHLLNLLIHVLAALTLFAIVRRTLLLVSRPRPDSAPPSSPERAEARSNVSPGREAEGPEAANERASWIAFSIALVWALHPLQTEAVTYVVQRAESMMGLFYLATLYGFIRAAAAGTAGKRPASAAWQAFSWAACLLGMGTKEVMASAPVMVWLYDRTFVAGGFAEALRRHRLYYFALATTWIPLATFVLVTGSDRGGTIGFGSRVGVSPWKYALSQLHAVAHYLRLAFWPRPLVFDYGTVWANGLSDVLPYAAVVLPLLAATVWLLVRRPALGFVGAWFFVILAPSSSFIPGNRQTISEHRMYLPLAAVVTVTVLGVARSRLGRTASLALLVAVAEALGVATYERNRAYATEIALYADNVANAPLNPYAHSNYGNALLAANRFVEAEREFKEAVRLKPDYAMAYYNLGASLDGQHRFADAVQAYRKSLHLFPANAKALNNIANSIGILGQPHIALRYFAAALHADPGSPTANYNTANTLASLGRHEEALPYFIKALKYDPDLAEARSNYGISLIALGRRTEALHQFELAVKSKPDHIPALYNLGVACLAADRFQEAVASFESILRLDPGNAAAKRGLDQARSRRAKSRL